MGQEEGIHYCWASLGSGERENGWRKAFRWSTVTASSPQPASSISSPAHDEWARSAGVQVTSVFFQNWLNLWLDYDEARVCEIVTGKLAPSCFLNNSVPLCSEPRPCYCLLHSEQHPLCDFTRIIFILIHLLIGWRPTFYRPQMSPPSRTLSVFHAHIALIRPPQCRPNNTQYDDWETLRL